MKEIWEIAKERAEKRAEKSAKRELTVRKNFSNVFQSLGQNWHQKYQIFGFLVTISIFSQMGEQSSLERVNTSVNDHLTSNKFIFWLYKMTRTTTLLLLCLLLVLTLMYWYWIFYRADWGYLNVEFSVTGLLHWLGVFKYLYQYHCTAQ